MRRNINLVPEKGTSNGRSHCSGLPYCHRQARRRSENRKCSGFDYSGHAAAVSASHNALQRAGLALNQVELVEVNEAFAAQYLACEKVLGLNGGITNVNGSGIALGHPVGCSGARITTTSLYEMRRRNARIGLATLCSGGGMGTALVVARD